MQPKSYNNLNTNINQQNCINKSSINQDLLNSFLFNNNNNYILPNKNNILINFPLTKSILKLYMFVFNFPEKFSFVVNEYTSLDFIRLHYISFIKLYNKNMDINSKLGDVNKLFENSNFNKLEIKRKIKRLIREIYNDDTYLKLIIELCKLHIKCLFNLAKNRNLDVGNKFMQLGVIDFFVKEIDLEHEAAEIIHRIKYQNEKSEKEKEKEKFKINMNMKMDVNMNLPSSLNNEENKEKIKSIEILNEIDNSKDFKNLIKNDLISEGKENIIKKIKENDINIHNKDIYIKNDYVNENKNKKSIDSCSLNDSEYDDLSLDFIDPEKFRNTNIKLNKGLKLDNLIVNYPIENNKNDINKKNNKDNDNITNNITEFNKENNNINDNILVDFSINENKTLQKDENLCKGKISKKLVRN
jgi:hypothetical protein